MKRLLLAVLSVAVSSGGASGADTPQVIRHVTVYSKAGRYGGWPANHGIWSWNNEIVVGFSAAYFQWLAPDRHPYDPSKPGEPYLAPSIDRGENWGIEPHPALWPPQ